MSLALTWSINCVISSFDKGVLAEGQPGRDDYPKNAIFKIKDTKILEQFKKQNKLLEQLKT